MKERMDSMLLNITEYARDLIGHNQTVSGCEYRSSFLYLILCSCKWTVCCIIYVF